MTAGILRDGGRAGLLTLDIVGEQLERGVRHKILTTHSPLGFTRCGIEGVRLRLHFSLCRAFGMNLLSA